MQRLQKEDHLAGKQHIARVKRTAARQSEEETPRATTLILRDSQRGSLPTEATPRPKKPGKAGGLGTKGKMKQAAVPKAQQKGPPYAPDHRFFGFEGSVYRGSRRYEIAFSLDDTSYGLCNKYCGWCGHCKNGIDI